MQRSLKTIQRGMTLLELSVVLLVLIALAGLAVPYVASTGQMTMCQATDATMQTVKEAIMGGAGGAGYYVDTLGTYPADRGDTDYNLRYLFVAGDGHSSDAVSDWPAFNPQTGVGWRGPYLMNGGAIDSAHVDGNAANGELDASYSQVFDPATNPSGKVHANIKTATDAQVFDAWRRPIILQIPYYDDDGEGPHEAQYHPDYARLVSAGPGSGLAPGDAYINTPITEQNAASRGYDRVLFLANPDPLPGGNVPCDQI